MVLVIFCWEKAKTSFLYVETLDFGQQGFFFPSLDQFKQPYL